MQKFVFFSTLFSSIIATGLLANPVKAVSQSQEPVSAINAVITKQPRAKIVNLAATSDFNTLPWTNNSQQNDSTDNINRIIGVTGLGIGTGFIGYRLYRTYNPSTPKSLADGQTNANTSLLNSLSPKLRKKLLQLVHNRETANRLLAGTKLSHANRSPNWLAEKVIYDLERDRL